MGITGATYLAGRESRLATRGAPRTKCGRSGSQVCPIGPKWPGGDAQNDGTEMLTLLRAPGQVGFRPIMNTGAPLGVRRMAFHGAHVAMNHCEAEKFALARLMGTASRAHSAPRADLAQRAKVGYTPCCTPSTLVALPPTFF